MSSHDELSGLSNPSCLTEYKCKKLLSENQPMEYSQPRQTKEALHSNFKSLYLWMICYTSVEKQDNNQDFLKQASLIIIISNS